MTGTPLGDMADQTVMGSVHNSDHRDFASGYSCGGSLKVSDASSLVSPTLIINMSRAGNHEELLSGMTNNMREAAMDALSVSIQDKSVSYIAAAGGSRPKPSAAGGLKLDPSISKVKFRSLFLENLCERIYVSIPRKVMETVSTRFANTFYGYFIIKRIVFLVVEYYVRNNLCKYGLTRIMMNSKGVFFFHFKTLKGLEDVLKNGHWMIRKSPSHS
nr:hypothetical protein [Tanacetum cinerariifolium]